MSHEKELFLRYLDGKASPAQKRQLLESLKTSETAQAEFKEVYKEWASEHGAAFDPYQSLGVILERISRRRPFRFPVWVTVGAALAVAMLSLVLFLPMRRGEGVEAPAPESGLYTWPESADPVAVLWEGQTVRSEATEMQVACTPGGIRIDGNEYIAPNGVQATCMLVIPFGHRARVLFADGSEVHMNAHSRMLFPLKFGKERNVRMTGEALFDVNRDARRPFIVKMDDLRVRVLGTRFLVSGREDESRKVALVSGSVNVSLGGARAQSVTLVPKQLYTLDDNGKINVEDVPDILRLLDWTNGTCCADGTSLPEVLVRVGRYYGEKIHCSPKVAGIACSGNLQLKENLSEMFTELSRIFPIKSIKQDGVWQVTLASEK